MMEEAGNPVKSMEWIVKTESDGRKTITNSVLIEFNESVVAPEFVKIGNIPYAVKPYIRLPTQCFNCQYYGHVAKYCKGACRCVYCGVRGHRKSENKCQVDRPKCCLCRGNHQAYSKRCPAYQRERVALIIKAKSKTSIHAAREMADRKHYPDINEPRRYQTPQEVPQLQRGSYARAASNTQQRRNSNTRQPNNQRRTDETIYQQNLDQQTTHTVGTRQDWSLPQPIRSEEQLNQSQQQHQPQPQPQPQERREQHRIGANNQSESPIQETNQNQQENVNNNQVRGQTQEITAPVTTREGENAHTEAAAETLIKIIKEDLKTTMMEILKEIMPKMLTTLLSTVYMHMPEEKKQDLMMTRVDEILDAHLKATLEDPRQEDMQEDSTESTEVPGPSVIQPKEAKSKAQSLQEKRSKPPQRKPKPSNTKKR